MAMGIFNRDATERKRDVDLYAAAVKYTNTVLDPMAAEAEAKLRHDNPDLLAHFEAELERQRTGFSYSFKRHGDFLTAALTRQGNDDSQWNRPAKRWAKTLNLGLVRSITLKNGRSPDEKGSFGWTVGHVHMDADGTEIGWGSSSGRPIGPPTGAYQYRVSPDASPTYVPADRTFAAEDKSEDRGHCLVMGSEGVNHRTEGFPRRSEDDAIRFDGIGLTIFAPFGMGEAMHEALLAELKAGAPTDA